MEERVGGVGRRLAGRLEVTLMEYHSIFKWREADNQSVVASRVHKFTGKHPELCH